MSSWNFSPIFLPPSLPSKLPQIMAEDRVFHAKRGPHSPQKIITSSLATPENHPWHCHLCQNQNCAPHHPQRPHACIRPRAMTRLTRANKQTTAERDRDRSICARKTPRLRVNVAAEENDFWPSSFPQRYVSSGPSVTC